jgi:hypothetical protein
MKKGQKLPVAIDWAEPATYCFEESSSTDGRSRPKEKWGGIYHLERLTNPLLDQVKPVGWRERRSVPAMPLYGRSSGGCSNVLRP